MKLRKILLALSASLLTAGIVTTPIFATSSSPSVLADVEVQPRTIDESQATSDDPEKTSDQPTLPAPTFAAEEVADDAGAFWFGKNLLYAGNNVSVKNISRGLLFAAGNNLQMSSESEYAFAAGNSISFSAATEKDLFTAGNTIAITKDAKIGRDIFAGAYSFALEADVPGDVSVAASRITIKDTIIKGNVNLDAEIITFQGEVKIDGTLSYNDDASVSGLTNVKYGKLETYTPTSRTTTAGEIWLTKMMSVIGLFFTIAIIFLVFPRAKKSIAREATVQRFGVDLMLGIGFVVIVPLLSMLFLLSFFAVSTGIFLIGIYCLIFYLAKAFAGAWLGHVIVEKLCHCTLPMLLEALIGILVITCASMVPGFGLLVTTLTLILGAGLIIACLRPGEKQSAEGKQVFYAAEEAGETTTPKQNSVKLAAAKSTIKTARKSSTKTSTTKALSTKSTAKKSSPKTKTSGAKSSSAKPKK